jgi:hypothetical protein
LSRFELQGLLLAEREREYQTKGEVFFDVFNEIDQTESKKQAKQTL